MRNVVNGFGLWLHRHLLDFLRDYRAGAGGDL
jgi:hypothetical protein